MVLQIFWSIRIHTFSQQKQNIFSESFMPFCPYHTPQILPLLGQVPSWTIITSYIDELCYVCRSPGALHALKQSYCRPLTTNNVLFSDEDRHLSLLFLIQQRLALNGSLSNIRARCNLSQMFCIYPISFCMNLTTYGGDAWYVLYRTSVLLQKMKLG